MRAKPKRTGRITTATMYLGMLFAGLTVVTPGSLYDPSHHALTHVIAEDAPSNAPTSSADTYHDI
jgi:hypothetical protein